ncbi:Galactoside O-acetyltransferase [Oligella ureolytica]|uniref:Acetyltransferase n=1 Tax=Oligella ureolytica TaxID=90244 RepID=A0A378XCX9_9BURK|nr:acetyltransferase [Oligella ureolytica]QPT40310.1 acetyltransferase [Oligella ureolytica]SUA50673.1 Galactoside O-acetyltransferase [Oligella ureolytica]SUA50935.1 Galactoside O-acetyltransferase [Oligella ureolytica]
MSNQNVYAVFGASGYGREVMPLARVNLLSHNVDLQQLYFIDDNAVRDSSVNGHKVLSFEQFLGLEAEERYVSIAIANSEIREKLSKRCLEHGVKSWTVIADNVCVLDNVELGEGAILNPFVTLTSDIKIGQHFHANIYSYVAHDCVIGDYVTFAPNVKCNGNIIIEDHAYIGTGAVLKQGTPDNPLVIGSGAVVGMGAVVTKSVPANTTVIGNPAKPLIKS